MRRRDILEVTLFGLLSISLTLYPDRLFGYRRLSAGHHVIDIGYFSVHFRKYWYGRFWG